MKRRTGERAWSIISAVIAAMVTICLVGTMVSSVMAQDDNELMMVHPVEDTFVHSLASSANFSYYSYTWVELKYAAGPIRWAFTYLKYDVPENIVQSDYELEDVRLTLTVQSYTNTPKFRVYATTSDWHEDTITWNNQPVLGAQIGVFDVDWFENFDTYEKIWIDMDNYTFTAGFNSFVLVPDNDAPSDAEYRIELFTREAGQFGTIEFTYVRIYLVPPQLVALTLIVTLAFAGFGLYKKMGEIHDLDSLIEGWVFLIYLSIMIITAVVLAWSFIG